MKATVLLMLSVLAAGATGCRQQAPQAPPLPAVGILDAQRQGEAVILTVLLKDEAKLQLFCGNAKPSECWWRSKGPTDVQIAFVNGRLMIGGQGVNFTEAESGTVRSATLERSFPRLPPGTKELRIGTVTKDGQEVAITAKLAPLSDAAKAKIHE